MSITRQCLQIVKRVVFGETLIPQEFAIGLEDPKAEVSVWLHSVDLRCDVTGRQTTACTAPLMLCIAFHDATNLSDHNFRRAVLKFCERRGQGRVLGEIRLRLHAIIPIGASKFVLFGVRSSINYCLPRARLWAHYLLHAYSQWRRSDPPDIKMTLLEQRAAAVSFIRPHPLSLVSVGNRSSGNIFTMNLMGDLGNGYFGFALRHLRVAADLVERAGRIAVSGIPLTRCTLAFQFAANYKKESIDWDALAFQTAPSAEFGIPVPDWATSVRELQILKVHRIGSHRLFIARVIRETHSTGLQACVVHGFYQFWRTKGDKAKLRISVAEDWIHKHGS
jgi:hypothetical protein